MCFSVLRYGAEDAKRTAERLNEATHDVLDEAGNYDFSQ